MADEEGLRKEAVRRHMAGEDAASIARDLDRSERWVYKWTGRFETGQDKWFVSDSRRPNNSPAVTSEEMVALVLAARDRLEADPRAQRGTASITWELISMGVQHEDLPRPRTIEHIIKRSGRSKPRRRQNHRYEPKGTPYPARVNRVGAGVVH